MNKPLHENTKNCISVDTKRLKVSIVGSCVTRDNFNSKFNPDWRKYFDCDVSAQQNSIISLVSAPFDLTTLDMDNLSEWERSEVHYESQRKFWIDLKDYQPDVIIIDLFTEVRFPVIDSGENYITDNSWRIGKSNGYKNLSNFNRISLKKNTDDYLKLFGGALVLFRKKLLKICPSVQIFLNAPEAASRYIDGKDLRHFNKEQVSEFNYFWQIINQKFIELFNPTVISTSSAMVVGDASHPWGTYFVHYQQDYYTQFLSRLLNKLGFKRRDRDLVYESGPFQINAFYNCKVDSRKWAKGSLNSHGRTISIDAGVYQSGYLLSDVMLRRSNGFIQSGTYHLELTAERHFSAAIYCGFLVDHYGHFLLEGLARLWSLSKLDAPILFQTPSGLNKITSLPKYMKEIFELLGISERIILVDKPISVETLYVPDMANVLDGYISKEFFQSLSLNDVIPKGLKTDLIYLSRSKLGSGIVSDESLFEDELKKYGYKVIYPEELSVKEQIEVISNCKILMGFVGSAFHTLVLCSHFPEKIVYLQRMKELNSNFKEIDHLLGLNALYIDAVISDDGVKGVGNVDFDLLRTILKENNLL